MHGSLNPNDSSTITIRSATQDDAQAIAEVYNHYVRVGGATFDIVSWTKTQVSNLLLINSPEVWMVGEADDRVLGWASARQFSNRHGFRMSLELAIYLMPDCVGKGLADQLITEVETRCRSANVHHLVSRVIASNERSMAFHFRHGYELVGIQKEIGNLDDRWIDLAILQKIL